MTLGADKPGVMSLFLVRVTALLGIGLALGVLGAWATTRLTQSMVYGISALSPLHMAGAAGVMMLVALTATLIPVLRATSVDPLEALRID